MMTESTAQKCVWVDTDITIGQKRNLVSFCDVDDAFALATLLRSPEIEVVGISSTLGNTDDIKVSTKVARKFIKRYGPTSLIVFQGSDKKISSCKKAEPLPEAVVQLAAQLRITRLTILSIGAATNIALLLRSFPELAEQIDEIVMVAGRRNLKQHFFSGHIQLEPFRDLNFEFDPQAFEVVFASEVPVTLVPFETCNQVWIRPTDLIHLAEANRVGKYLAKHSAGWLAEWEIAFGAAGFNPFDQVAAGYVIEPQKFTGHSWKARVEVAKDDTGHKGDKPYLICSEKVKEGRTVNYLVQVDKTCKKEWLQRICTHDMSAFVLGMSHVNVVVNSIEEATEYYHRVLGFEQAYDANGQIMDYNGVEMQSFALDAGLMDGKCKLDVRFLRHPQASLYLELMHYIIPEGKQQLPPQPRTYDAGGPRHIAMEVSNCTEVFNYLKKQEGVAMISSDPSYHPVKLDGFPITFFYWLDKYGVQWEMEEGRRVGSSRGIV